MNHAIKLPSFQLKFSYSFAIEPVPCTRVHVCQRFLCIAWISFCSAHVLSLLTARQNCNSSMQSERTSTSVLNARAKGKCLSFQQSTKTQLIFDSTFIGLLGFLNTHTHTFTVEWQKIHRNDVPNEVNDGNLFYGQHENAIWCFIESNCSAGNIWLDCVCVDGWYITNGCFAFQFLIFPELSAECGRKKRGWE